MPNIICVSYEGTQQCHNMGKAANLSHYNQVEVDILRGQGLSLEDHHGVICQLPPACTETDLRDAQSFIPFNHSCAFNAHQSPPIQLPMSRWQRGQRGKDSLWQSKQRLSKSPSGLTWVRWALQKTPESSSVTWSRTGRSSRRTMMTLTRLKLFWAVHKKFPDSINSLTELTEFHYKCLLR